jgi:hypothetical protein
MGPEIIHLALSSVQVANTWFIHHRSLKIFNKAGGFSSLFVLWACIWLYFSLP